jgi:uncharacterized membrane protein YjjP (DUF1212 family)
LCPAKKLEILEMKTLNEDAQSVGNILIETGAMLMSSGANSNRIRVTLERIANGLGYKTELLITHRALMLTIIEKDQQHFFSRLKRTSPHGVNFRIVSGISHLSWNVIEQNWTVAQISEELKRLKSLPHYPRLVILGLVGLAGSAFCNIFGGGYIEMTVAFVATFVGLFVRQEAMKMKFNPYLCVFFAAFAASFIAGLAEHCQIGSQPDKAFATSVLFLVPGVPLINSVTDLLEGNIQNGLVRAINGLMISFSIAMGLFSVKMILNF